MKKLLLLCLLTGIVCLGYSQKKRVTLPASLKNKAVDLSQVKTTTSATRSQSSAALPANAKASRSVDEEQIGQTNYDLQSKSCTPYGRYFYYDDGTMGAVWTKSVNSTTLGTGYNYYDGTAWQVTGSVGSINAGWPSYAALGANGEMIAAHRSATQPLVISTRSTKGSGDWTQTTFNGPDGHQLMYPRLVTGGSNHNIVHLFALTAPVAEGGTPYQGQDGALVYSRSTDGGATWTQSNVILNGMGSADYANFHPDKYSWVEPKDDNLAFIVCDNQNDLFVMRSADAGATWQKTVIWQHPYPHWNGISATDTFYCPDGSAHGAFDSNGLLHVAFGLTRLISDGTTIQYFPWIDGIAYWNENLPTWVGGTHEEQCNCLDPDILDQQGSLIAWMQDINGNGQLDIVGLPDSYNHLGPTSMPQLAIDNNNMICLLYSGITETFDNGSLNYRHIWGVCSGDGGQTWGFFEDFTGDVLHAYDECVFPSIATKVDDKFYCIYQADNEPGLSNIPGDNYIRYLAPYLPWLPCLPSLVGKITYPKNAPVPLSNVTINLKDTQGNVVAYQITDSNGDYTFWGLSSGNYTIDCSITKPWGGVSAADVLLYKKHIAGIAPLTGIFLASGDVNASGELTATDVLLIKKRIANVISDFPAGDWLFNCTTVTIPNTNTTVTENFNGMIYGDANGSYVPPAK